MATGEITRRGFLAGSASLLLLGLPKIGEAQPARKGSSRRVVRGIMSYYGAKDDGNDQSLAFKQAFSDRGVDEIVLEDTPSGQGYALDLGQPEWEELRLKSNLTVRGEGWGSRIVQIGDFVDKRFLFLNQDQVKGNDNVVFDGVNIEGKWDQYPTGTAPIGPQNPMMIVLRMSSKYVESGGQVCDGFQMKNCRIENWPGKVLTAFSLSAPYVANNHVDRISGGAFVFRYRTPNALVENNRATNVCDDAIAFNARENTIAPEGEFGPAVNALTRNNVLSRFNPEWAGGSATGPVYSIRGGQVTSQNDQILPSPGEGYHLINWMDVDAKLELPTIDGTAETPLLVSAGCYGYAHDALITNSPPVVNDSPDTFDITYHA